MHTGVAERGGALFLVVPPAHKTCSTVGFIRETLSVTETSQSGLQSFDIVFLISLAPLVTLRLEPGRTPRCSERSMKACCKKYVLALFSAVCSEFAEELAYSRSKAAEAGLQVDSSAGSHR